MKSNLKQTIAVLHLVEDAMLILSLTCLLVVALLQIGLRNFFDSGIIWADSFLRILVLWVTMFGAMIAAREQSHIKIDVLARYLPDSYQQGVSLVTSLVAAMVCGIATYFILVFVSYEYKDGTLAFAAVPVWLCQSVIPLGFAVMTIRFSRQAVLHSFLCWQALLPVRGG